MNDDVCARVLHYGSYYLRFNCEKLIGISKYFPQKSEHFFLYIDDMLANLS